MIALQTLRDTLAQEEFQNIGQGYRVPALWARPDDEGTERIVAVDAVPFFIERIDAIIAAADESPEQLASAGEWTRDAVVYNMFTRLTAAWDHDGNGSIGIEDLPGGLRETGTFLKSIAMLPYLRRMGINTIHLLPITAIGSDGNKGTLGSPYAIRNPYALDERLAEPFHGLGVDAEYALVEIFDVLDEGDLVVKPRVLDLALRLTEFEHQRLLRLLHGKDRQKGRDRGKAEESDEDGEDGSAHCWPSGAGAGVLFLVNSDSGK